VHVVQAHYVTAVSETEALWLNAVCPDPFSDNEEEDEEGVVEEEELRGGQNDEHRDCFGIRLEEQLDEEEPNESDESDEEKEDEDVVPMDLEDEVNVAIEVVRSSAAAKKKKKTKGANIRKSYSIKQKFRSLEYMEKVEKELEDRRWQSNSPKATLSASRIL
jgi:hypothetical protein